MSKHALSEPGTHLGVSMCHMPVDVLRCHVIEKSGMGH